MDVFKFKKILNNKKTLNSIRNILILLCATISASSVSARDLLDYSESEFSDMISNVETLSNAKKETENVPLKVPKNYYSFVRKVPFFQGGEKVYDFYELKHKPSNAIINVKKYPEGSSVNLDNLNNSIRCVCEPDSDDDKPHAAEHVLARGVHCYLLNKYNFIRLSDFSAYTDEFGFTFSARRDFCDEDYYKKVFSQLKGEDFKKDKELFNTEKKRVYHETLNNLQSQNAKTIRFRNIRNYGFGGNPSSIKNLKFEELISWIDQNVTSSNIVIDLNVGADEGQKLYNTLGSLGEILNDFYNCKPSTSSNLSKHVEFRKDASVYKKLKYNEGAQIFSGKGLNGGFNSYKYCAILNIDVSSMSAYEKNSLFLNGAIYKFLLQEALKKYNIESLSVDSSDILHGFLTLNLRTNDIRSLENESIAVATCKDLIKIFCKNLKSYQKNIDLLGYNNYINCQIFSSYRYKDKALKRESYMKNYNLENLRSYSLLKYGEQFSDKVFCFKNDALNDSVEVVKESILSNSILPFNKLESQHMYITVLEQDGSNRKYNFEDNDLVYIAPIKYSKKNTPEAIKMLADNLLTYTLNQFVKDKTYNQMQPAYYPGGGPTCYTNKESQAEINAYLKNNLQNIKNFIKSQNYNYKQFIETCKNELKHNMEEFGYVLCAIRNYCEEINKECEDVDDKMQKSGEDKNANYFLDFEGIYDVFENIFENERVFFPSVDEYEKFRSDDKEAKRKLNVYLYNGDNLRDRTGLFFMGDLIVPYVRLKQSAYETSVKSTVKLLEAYNKIDLNNAAVVEQIKKEILECIDSATYTLK